jgi:hypothetical protein
METTISIPLSSEVARIYERATEEEKRKVQWLVEMLLADLFDAKGESLMDVVRDISAKAESRGLTPEILDALLQDDDE